MISGIKLMRVEPCFRALKPVYVENQQQVKDKNIKLPETSTPVLTIPVKQSGGDTFTSSVKEQVQKPDKKDSTQTSKK